MAGSPRSISGALGLGGKASLIALWLLTHQRNPIGVNSLNVISNAVGSSVSTNICSRHILLPVDYLLPNDVSPANLVRKARRQAPRRSKRHSEQASQAIRGDRNTGSGIGTGGPRDEEDPHTVPHTVRRRSKRTTKAKTKSSSTKKRNTSTRSSHRTRQKTKERIVST